MRPLLVLLVLGGVLAGCGSSNEPTSTAATPTLDKQIEMVEGNAQLTPAQKQAQIARLQAMKGR